MRGIKAGLLMLGKTRAVEIIDRIARHLQHGDAARRRGGSARGLDRLADAIVSVEYYMETLQAGRTDPWYMLDNAETASTAVEQMPRRVVPTVRRGGNTSRTPRTWCSMPADGAAGDAGASPPRRRCSRRSSAAVAGASLEPQSIPSCSRCSSRRRSEEVARIEQICPAWDQNPLDEDALITSRRSFHTLKGSGRMVGARELSEFAWAIENLINRLIDKTLTRSPADADTCCAMRCVCCPSWSRTSTAAQPRPATSLGISARAHALAAGRTRRQPGGARPMASAPAPRDRAPSMSARRLALSTRSREPRSTTYRADAAGHERRCRDAMVDFGADVGRTRSTWTSGDA